MFVVAMSLAVMAYVLFFVYDIANVRAPQAKIASLLFPFSCLLVLVSAVLMVVISLPSFSFGVATVASLLLSAVFFLFMVDALFFSLPKDTYTEPGERRRTYRGKMYAICRHPGVLWYALAFVFLMIPFANVQGWMVCAALVAGNVAYMIFQDVWTFPLIFSDYGDYKNETPMFFPNTQSLNVWKNEMLGRFRKAGE